jgi:hypothetical protein
MSCRGAAPAVPLVAVEGFWQIPIAVAYRILEQRAASIIGDVIFLLIVLVLVLVLALVIVFIGFFSAPAAIRPLSVLVREAAIVGFTAKSLADAIDFWDATVRGDPATVPGS